MRPATHRSFFRSLALASTALLLCLLTSCVGYRLGDVKPAEMSGIVTLAIPTAKNDTLEPRLSALLTTGIMQQFQRDGTYKIASTKNADAVLNVVITELDRRSFRISRSDFLASEQLEFKLTIEYWVEDTATGEILSDGDVTGSTWGLAEANLQLSERQALEFASQRVAETLMSEVSEGW